MAQGGPLVDGNTGTAGKPKAAESSSRDGTACPCRHKDTPRSEELQAISGHRDRTQGCRTTWRRAWSSRYSAATWR